MVTRSASLMRIMPLALYLHQTMGPCWDDEEDVHEIVHNASRITPCSPDQFDCLRNLLLHRKRDPVWSSGDLAGLLWH